MSKLKSKIIALVVFILLAIFFIPQKYIVETKVLPRVSVNNMQCNPQVKECKVDIDDIRLNISLDKNIYYLKPFNIVVGSNDKNGSKIKDIHIEFKMKNMDMGVNRFKLTLHNNKHWKSKLLLPICITGRADWIAALEVVTESSEYVISFPLSVEKVVS